MGETSTESTSKKVSQLQRSVGEMGSVAVAFSGGTDSTYLLAVCLDVLGPDRVLALTSDSPLMPRAEMEEARALAAQLGARHLVLPSDDLANPGVAANRPDRCYHCKLARFTALWQVARREGLRYLVHGENADDAVDYRPGSQAALELGVRAPLREAGLTKAEVRRLARQRGLPNWNRPANSCLASRFPYETALTPEALERVEAAEELLRREFGLSQLRVRDHFPLARLEVPPEEIQRLARAENRDVIVKGLRALGYRYIALDLEGYRLGSLNETLSLESGGDGLEA